MSQTRSPPHAVPDARESDAMRLVVDTNVMVSAVLSDGAPRKILSRCIAREATLLESPATLQELVEVLRRPKFGLVEDQVHRILAAVVGVAEVVETTTVLDAVAEDPDDNRFLELAVDGAADRIVSGDRHLLDLKAFRGIPVLRAADAL